MMSDRFQKLTNPAYKIQPSDYKSYNDFDDVLMIPLSIVLRKLGLLGFPFDTFCKVSSYNEYLIWLGILGIDDDYLFCNDMRYFWNVMIYCARSKFSSEVVYRYDNSTEFLKLKDGE